MFWELVIRGHKILLDVNLAELYGVETKILKRTVRRNQDRSPEGFMFQLTKQELNNLRCQFGTSSYRQVSKHDTAIAEIIEAIRQLMVPPSPKEKRRIGFAPWEDK